MLKFKNSATGNQNSLCFNGKFPLCFNSSLNSCRDLNSFNFIGRLFHETLPLKFNEFIPYFWVFAFGIKREISCLISREMSFCRRVGWSVSLSTSLSIILSCPFAFLFDMRSVNLGCIWCNRKKGDKDCGPSLSLLFVY